MDGLASDSCTSSTKANNAVILSNILGVWVDFSLTIKSSSRLKLAMNRKKSLNINQILVIP